jgi:hypothetical protein
MSSPLASCLCLLLLSSAACAAEVGPTWSPRPEEPSLIRALATPSQFDLEASGPDGAGSLASAVGGLLGDDEASSVRAPLPLEILGGYAELRATPDELIVLQGLHVDLADVSVDAAIFPPRGIALTGLEVLLASPVVLRPLVQENRVTASIQLDLMAEWAIDLGDGRVHPLNPVQLDQLSASVVVDRNLLGELRVGLTMTRDGPFWTWIDRFELSDLELSLVGGLSP